MAKKPFQFTGKAKIKHGSYHEISGHVYKIPKKPEPPAPGLWQNKPVGSVQEWRFILALEHYKFQYEYQVPIAGGRTRRGGQVLDFMVYTEPLYTPISIVGEYWHGGQNALDDELREYSLQSIYRGKVKQLLKVKDYEIPDVDSAMKIVRRELITGS